MADHIFDITDMNNYQRDTENKLNSQISSLTAKKTQLAAKLSTAKSKLSSAQAWNSNSENTSKIDTGPIEAEINQLESDISTIDGQVGELNTAITDTREFIRNLINTVTTTDGNYSKTLKQMNDSIKAYTDKMGKMSENFKNMGLTSKNEDIRKLTLNFSSDLQKNFSKAFNLNEGAVTTVKEVFLEGLPQDLKSLITIDDLIATDDGFAMCLKDIATLLSDMNYTELNNVNINAFYDDWYLYGISDVNSKKTSYSLLSLRELEHDLYKDDSGNQISDSNIASISLSFASLDISKFVKNNGDSLGNEIKNCISPKGYSHNQVLVDYFSNTKSKASYLIAEAYVDKIIKTEIENGYLIANIGTNKENYQTGTLITNPRIINYLKSNSSINYDEETGKIIFLEGYSQDAKRAILAARIGNTSYNSLAAEIQFHALTVKENQVGAKIYYSDNTNKNDQSPYNKFIIEPHKAYEYQANMYDHAIVSTSGLYAFDKDFGLEESIYMNTLARDRNYFDDNSRIVKNQRSEHGEN